jgi:hypothetical protein
MVIETPAATQQGPDLVNVYGRVDYAWSQQWVLDPKKVDVRLEDLCRAINYNDGAMSDLDPRSAAEVLAALDRMFDQMIAQQRQKVLRLAREVVPNIGPEDVLNPHDFPELKAHPTFEFEDGLLSGLVAAHIAARAEIHARFMPAPDAR